MNDVIIIGLGYIGLPTAIVLAEYGLKVVGIDVDLQRVQAINTASPAFYEPELQERLQQAVANGLLTASSTMVAGKYYIIAVPTPHTITHQADLSYVWAAARALVPVLKIGDCVIIESTIPVGTTRKVAQFLTEVTGLSVGEQLFVAHSPERVLPGKIFSELLHNNRVIGGVSAVCAEHAAKLYRHFVRGEITTCVSEVAEMVKLVENASRDVQIAFAHQVAGMAESIGVSSAEIISLANKHPRVNILTPTCGVGGHCIAIDPWFLIESFPDNTGLLLAARQVNDARPVQIIEYIRRDITQWQQENPGRQCKLLLGGIAYKPDIDDIRESPALQIVQHFAQDVSLQVYVIDPMVSEHVGQRAVAPALFNNQKKSDWEPSLTYYLVRHTAFNNETPVMQSTKETINNNKCIRF